MVRSALRSLWDEPRVPDPPPLTWPDAVLVVVLMAGAVLETLLRPDLAMRPLALFFGLAALPTLLWRRSEPLAAVVVAFGVHAASSVAPLFGHDHEATMLYGAAFVLVLPYSLLRWGSGREAVIGIAFVLASHVVLGPGESAAVGEWVAGVAVLLLPAALGASIRYRASSRVREIDGVRLREREQLARELHDTVAHHVSAIAIQAQAGRAVAATDPHAALDALGVIEREASRTLAEMRTMIGVLRQGEEPALVPQPGVAELVGLASRGGGPPVVEVTPPGDLGALAPSVDAAVYRLAQESVTNALRHARRASRVRVSVVGEPDHIRLTVVDDGETGPFGAAGGTTGTGYGIVGMTERATLLGGSLVAGPDPDRGWRVTAVLPRTGGAR